MPVLHSCHALQPASSRPVLALVAAWQCCSAHCTPRACSCELLACALHTAESVPLCSCHPWGKCPTPAPTGLGLHFVLQSSPGCSGLAALPWAWSQALLKQLQFPGQVSGCPDPRLSSSGAAVPWLQPAVPQGAHPSRLLPHQLMPRQGQLINLDSSRNPKLVSISVYFYFLIQSPWCQN